MFRFSAHIFLLFLVSDRGHGGLYRGKCSRVCVPGPAVDAAKAAEVRASKPRWWREDVSGASRPSSST